MGKGAGMTLGGIDLVALMAMLMVASTPILLAATGELIAEKAGVLNLGVEGMMIMGAIGGFAGAVMTGSPALGFLAGACAGAAMALVFGFLTQVLLSNQVATGLALTLFGMGLSALIGKGFEGVRPPATGKLDLGGLADLPVLGPVLFRHDWVVYLSLALIVAVWLFLHLSRAGLIVRAVGENHDAAHALGYRVVMVRLAALAFGGALAGLGGAYLSLVRVPQWTEGMTAGAGWIALAIVVFASWRIERVLLGAYLFGGVTVLQLRLQAAGYAIPVQLLSMAPYVITILVLVIISARHRRGAQAAPAALGRIFHASR
jgi:simple sugar transport system permease protein